MRKERGITLIALIITIIIMLILVAVSVNIIVKSNIIGTAEKTANGYKAAQDGESNNGKIIINGKEYDSFNQYVKDEIPDWDGVQTELPQLQVNTENNKFDWYIYNEPQLKFLANFVNKTLTDQDMKVLSDNNITQEDIQITEDTTIYLMNDLNLGAKFDEDGNLVSGKEWVPIGKASILSGTFEGNNHYICGVYVNSNTLFNGIFGNTNTIKNLTIKNSYIAGGGCTAGIVGAIRGGRIENCHNINTTVILKEGNNWTAGGVVGQSQATQILGCTNSGTILGYGTDGNRIHKPRRNLRYDGYRWRSF